MQVEIPEYYHKEAESFKGLMPDLVKGLLPLDGIKPLFDEDHKEMYLNWNWRPSLTVIGIDDIPPTTKAGNVIRKSTKFAVSIWVPPSLKGEYVYDYVKKTLEHNPPYGARVRVEKMGVSNGY